MMGSSKSILALVTTFILTAHASPVLDVRQIATSLPSPWGPIGCFSDTPTSRTLKIASFTAVSNMTIEACIAFCTPAGYTFAGVEFSRECYCDNVIQSTGTLIDVSQCDMACTGDSEEICGGTGAINIFRNLDKPQDIPSPWTTIGCFSDTPDSRTLKIAAFTDVNNMTVESCLEFCTPAGYSFAGVEFSRECYCDNIIESTGFQISNTTCNMPCTGDEGEICGGTGAITIFKNTAIGLPPPPPPASQKQSSGTFEFQGCFQDGVNGLPRSLPNQINIAGGATAETCTAACQASGFVVAGLEFGAECWCGGYMQIATQSQNSECNMPCDADNTELCGAGNRLSVYVDSSAPPLSLSSCLPTSVLPATSSQFNIQMVPTIGSSTPVLLGAIFEGTFGPSTSILRGIFELSGRNSSLAQAEFNITAVAHIFTFSNGQIFPDNAIPQLFSSTSMPPSADVSLGFEAEIDAPLFQGYCAGPNPISPSTFIGPPVLAVNGNGSVWFICSATNPLTPIFSPTSRSGTCSGVILELTPPVVGV